MPKPLTTQNWTTVIKPKSGWFDINLRELWRYPDLIMLFVKRDFTAVYKQTILGPLWFVFQPLFSTLVFTIIFGNVAKIPTDGVPHALFYLAGIIAWNYFASCLDKTSDTFYANAGMFGKVYFPRLSVPLSIVITNLITLAIQFAVFVALLLFYYFKGTDISLHWSAVFLPFLILQMAALGLGTGIIVSSLTTRYRDFKYLLSFGIQLWMYASPVVYPLSQVPEKWRAVYLINPMASVIETFKFMFLGVGGVNFGEYAIGLAVTVVLLATGIILFSRIEKTFMDTI